MAVPICDLAGWQQSGTALKVPDNFVLLHVPPYSPELKPTEEVRDYLRQTKLCARVRDCYDSKVDACVAA